MRNRRLGQDRVLEIGERVETILTAPLDVDIEHDKPGAVAPGGNTDQRLRPALPPWRDRHLVGRCGMKATADKGLVSSLRQGKTGHPRRGRGESGPGRRLVGGTPAAYRNQASCRVGAFNYAGTARQIGAVDVPVG